MSKISYRQYRELIEDPESDEDEIADYSVVEKGETGFDFRVMPNPEKVEMTQAQQELENALSVANDITRWRRGQKFKSRVKKGERLPIIVSEGDSWFQFPILVKEIVDQLKDDYLIYSVGAAGDTAENMVFSDESKKKTEYMRAIRKLHDDDLTISGFMFSAAGNDIIGESADGTSALFKILRDFNGNVTDIMGHINLSAFHERINFLTMAYMQVISTIRSEPGLARTPIFVHGYDYVYPHPWTNDPRKPKHAKKNEWLGKPLDKRGIMDMNLRRNIIKFMLDRLYDMLRDIAADSGQTGVWVVDCRGAMPNVSDWIDEIHGTSDGFEEVGNRFRKLMRAVIPPIRQT